MRVFTTCTMNLHGQPDTWPRVGGSAQLALGPILGLYSYPRWRADEGSPPVVKPGLRSQLDIQLRVGGLHSQPPTMIQQRLQISLSQIYSLSIFFTLLEKCSAISGSMGSFSPSLFFVPLSLSLYACVCVCMLLKP